MTVRYYYRRWDGSQDLDGLDADDVLYALTDDLLAVGDLDAALRRTLRRGLPARPGDRIQGLREMLERLRARRNQLLSEGAIDGRLDQLAASLAEIEGVERSAIDSLEDQARRSGDQRRQHVTSELCRERRMALDLLADDLAGRLSDMQRYEFISHAARQHFDDLLEQLRREILDTYVEGMTRVLDTFEPTRMSELRHALDALNLMLEQRRRGEEPAPSFEDFMDRYGHLVPAASSLDELLAQLGARMAAAEAMWRSMSAEQRDQLRQVAAHLFADLDLAWQLDRLQSNLQAALADAWGQEAYQFVGARAMGISEATDVTGQLREIDRLERVLQSASAPASLAEIDLDQARRHLGDDAAQVLQRMARLTEALREAGLVERRGTRLELTPKGARRLGQRALDDLFSVVARDHVGRHRTAATGSGHDPLESTKPHELGDPLNLHLSSTVHNAVRRVGPGVPLRLSPEDFAIVESEASARSATVLLLDLSMSMPMRDNFVPAKKMAMALQTLISSRFPGDYLGIVGFSEVAREIKAPDLPTAMWDYVYGTNLQHALLLARRLLVAQRGTKQIIVVTDGEPTAHTDAKGEPSFHYPPLPETLERTMAEVVRCTRDGITINVFALDVERTRFPFVEQIARVNGGRTFSTTPGRLGGYVLGDFVEHRRVIRPAD